MFAVKKDRAEVFFGDDPVVQATVAADSSLVQGAQLVKPIPIWIALRPGDSRISASRRPSRTCTRAGRWARA